MQTRVDIYHERFPDENTVFNKGIKHNVNNNTDKLLQKNGMPKQKTQAIKGGPFPQC